MTNNRLGNDLDLQLKNRTGGVDERDAYRQTVVASPVLPDSVRQHIIQRRNFRIEDQFEEDGDGGVDQQPKFTMSEPQTLRDYSPSIEVKVDPYMPNQEGTRR